MQQLFTYTFATRGWPVWLRYLVTFVIVTAILIVRLWLDWLLLGYPFLLFFAAIILCAVLFDRGSGLLAVILSAVYAVYFLIPPERGFSFEELRNIAPVALFVAIGLATATVIETLHTTLFELTNAQRALEQANRRLAASDAEKDILLREAAHRMKNDLAMVVAMIKLQQRAVQDTSAKAALLSTANRIQVLARAHDRLQRFETDAVVDTAEFMTELSNDLSVGMVGLRPIALRVDIERHTLDQQRAVAVGLLTNELVTNALKHAFPNDRSGNIGVRFTRSGDEFRLEISDDGIGTAFSNTARASESGLGQRLIRSLVAQLGGTFEIAPDSGDPGTRARITFPVSRPDAPA